MSSAVLLYREMLKERLAPALRATGLKGSGTTFQWPSTTHWVLLGFQSSMANSAISVKFTVNCKVVRRDVWTEAAEARPFIGVKPKANVGAGAFEWWCRIGDLMPDRRDVWWTVAGVGDVPLVSERVRVAIVSYALPAMRAQIETTRTDGLR